MPDSSWLHSLFQKKPAKAENSVKTTGPVTAPAIPGTFCPGDGEDGDLELDSSQYSVKRQSDLSEVLKVDLTQYRIERCTDPYPVPKLVLSGYCIERNSDIPLGQPYTGEVWPNSDTTSKIVPPDISQGLGKRQEARDIVRLERFLVSRLQLMVYHDNLYIYKPPFWRKLTENQAGAEIRSVLEAALNDDCLTRSDYSKIYRSLLINRHIRQEEELIQPESMINMLDGTYDIRANRLFPHRADDYFLSCINVRGMELASARGNSFEAFVRNCSDGDPAVREQLLQLVALAILKRPLKHFFVLLGESNTGKTQFGRFLEELVGRDNVASIRGVQDFADRWTVGSLAGKMLATCLDLPDKPLPSVAIGTIKQFVGDDPIKGEAKYGHPFTFYEKPLLLFAGNHPIQIPNMDKEKALLNRMVVIPFRNPIAEADMQQDLYKDLLNEAPYIVRKALDAYRELERNNFQLTQAKLPLELMSRDPRPAYRSIKQFLGQCCDFNAEAEVQTGELYAVYCDYIEDSGFQLSLPEFSRCLKRQLSEYSGVIALKRVANTDKRGYRGIQLKGQMDQLGSMS